MMVVHVSISIWNELAECLPSTTATKDLLFCQRVARRLACQIKAKYHHHF